MAKKTGPSVAEKNGFNILKLLIDIIRGGGKVTSAYVNDDAGMHSGRKTFTLHVEEKKNDE